MDARKRPIHARAQHGHVRRAEFRIVHIHAVEGDVGLVATAAIDSTAHEQCRCSRAMIGAAGGMLMAAFQVLVVNTMGPVGINAANVLKPSNMALTLFSPLGSFYRYAVVEKRVAWPVGLSFGVVIFIGSIWLGKYVSAVLPMKAYQEWLAILVLLMGIKTLMETNASTTSI